MDYTKYQNVALLLDGRIIVPDGDVVPHAGAKQVKPETIEYLGDQIEAMLNSALKQIYVLPIPKNAKEARNILGGVVDQFIAAQLIAIHFTQTQTDELNTDAGYGNVLKGQARKTLAALFHGHGIFIPGLMDKPNDPVMGMIVQPIVLPDVELKLPQDQPDTFSRHESYVAKRQLTAEQRPFSY